MPISHRTVFGRWIIVSISILVIASLPTHGFSEQPTGNSLTNWVSLGPINANISDIGFDPFNTDIIYAGATGLITSPNVGMLKTTDGGTNWTTINNGLPPFGTIHIAIDEHDPSTIYAGVFGQGIFKSTNGGVIFESWG